MKERIQRQYGAQMEAIADAVVEEMGIQWQSMLTQAKSKRIYAKNQGNSLVRNVSKYSTWLGMMADTPRLLPSRLSVKNLELAAEVNPCLLTSDLDLFSILSFSKLKPIHHCA